jgi:hypothetical protein
MQRLDPHSTTAAAAALAGLLQTAFMPACRSKQDCECVVSIPIECVVTIPVAADLAHNMYLAAAVTAAVLALLTTMTTAQHKECHATQHHTAVLVTNPMPCTITSNCCFCY